jgi:tol-pal system protein YbgF
MRNRTLRLFGVMAIGALFGACATTPEIDPMQLRLDDLDARVGRIDRIVANQSLMQMAQRVDALQEEVRGLKGRQEELQNENVQLRKEQRDLYADLERRLVAAPVAASTAATTTQNEESVLYARAFEHLKARNYTAAIDGFRSLAASHPNGQLADNTQYWLGEAYYVSQDYDHAVAAFQRVLDTWPDSRKAPDALLKLGYTQQEQKKIPAARVSLQQVITKYPGSDAARLAADRLTKLPKP